MENTEIARRLEEVADLLKAQRANRFRVQAYRRAAMTIRRLPKAIAEIWREEGEEGLRAVVGVGGRLATSLRILITTGRLPMLERLRGETDPVALLESVPGIGRALAERLHRDFEIDSLEDLDAAAHDGRLSDIAGIGKKKLAGIMDTLTIRLGRVRLRTLATKADEPPIEELLDVDREYRDKAAANELSTIAPRRFNPSGEAWLPILHTHRGERIYTALYSNTAHAHDLGRTRDWVLLYFDGGLDERQCTIITSQWGKLLGKRIVRGREMECEEFYFGKGATVPVKGNSKPTTDPPIGSCLSGSDRF
jgi:putative hydrolase